jgi:hypothetical protein
MEETKTKVDRIKVAEGSPFECEVTRSYGDNVEPVAILFAALIEEILRLKAEIEQLKETKH